MYRDRLVECRELMELTQYDVSKIMQFKKDTYGEFEREKTIIPVKHLNSVCNFFDISIDYAFSFTNIKNYKNSKQNIDLELSANRLKEFRKENILTQEKLASYLGTVRPTIVKYEKAKNSISTQFLYAICKKYNISADYLLGKTDTPKYLK